MSLEKSQYPYGRQGIYNIIKADIKSISNMKTQILNIENIEATVNQSAGKIVTVSVDDTSIQNLERVMKETGADVLVF